MRRSRVEALFMIPIVLFLGLFVVYPLVRVAYQSVAVGAGSFTLSNYISIVAKPQYFDAVRSSLLFASAATIVAVIGGTFVAYFSLGLSRARRNVLLSIYALPLTLSGLVVAFAFIVLLGQGGIVNLILRDLLLTPRGGGFNLYSWLGLVIVYMFFQVPLMTLAMAPVFENLDKSTVEAARNLGATAAQRWRLVILPAVAPGVVAGASIVFAGMVGAYGTALAITGLSHNLLSLQIYANTSDATFDLPQSAALSVVLVGLTSCALLLFDYLGGRLQPGADR